MSDAFKCFECLKSNSLKWLSELSALEKHVEQKQEEMSKADARPSETGAQPVRSGSIVSIREQVFINGYHVPRHDIDGSTDAPEDSAHPSASRRRRLVKRTKRPQSLLSSTMSDVPRFRTRNMIIVYYDAEIQKAFEKLVREIGNGRHLIRKAKMAARAEAFSNGIDDEALYEMADGAVAPNMRIMSFRRAGTSSQSSHKKLGSCECDMPSSALERVDRALETAQGLCERAAHQFLRDGDCRPETESAKEYFQEVLRTSTEELARLEVEEKAKSRYSCDTRRRPFSDLAVDEQWNQNESRSNVGVPGLHNIEVDDSEEQMPLELPILRMTSRMGPRKASG